MYDGYLMFGGTEVVNADRTAAYARTLVPRFGLRHNCGCDGLQYVVNRPDGFIAGPEGRTAAQVRAASEYRSPQLDRPDWYDPNDSDTWGFAGLYPLSIVGVDGSSRTASVQESNLSGGVVQRPRLATKDIRVSGLLIGDSHRSMMAGFRWLDQALSGDGCEECQGSSVCYFSSCPDCISLTGYDYAGTPNQFQMGGSGGWRAQGGGTYVQNIPAHRGTWTPTSLASYLEFSPMTAVCDDMEFRVGFPEDSAPLIVNRRNLIPNPRYARTVGSEPVRRNLAANPTASTELARWSRFTNTTGRPIFARVVDGSLRTATSVQVRTVLRDTWNVPSGGSTVGSYVQHGAYPVLPGQPVQAGSTPTPGIVVNDSKPFAASIYVVSSFLTGLRMAALFYDSNGVQVGATALGPVGDPLNAWTRLTLTLATLPAGAETCVIRVQPTTAEEAVAGSFTQYGALLVEQRKTVGQYFDGDSVVDDRGWATKWTGTPGQSPSERLAPIASRALVHFNNFPSGNDLPDTVGGRSTEPTPPGGTSAAPYTYSVLLTNTPSNAIIANSPRMNLNPGDIAGARLQARIGGVAPSTVVLSLVAVDTAGAVLGTLATSAAETLVNTTWLNLIAPSSVAAPAGTVGCVLRVTFVGTPTGDEIVEFRNVLVQPMTAFGPPPLFFSGATADTATIDYRWSGVADDSVSEATTPNPAARPLKLEAWGNGTTLFAETIGNTTDDITLVVDGTPWETITYRLVPVDTFGAVVLDSVSWSFHQPLGEDGYDYTTFAGAYYNPDDGAGAGGGIDDPPGTKVDNDVRKYRRTMRGVTCVSGPTIIEEFDSPNASTCRVEFILTAAVPWRYGEEVPAGWLSLNTEFYSDPVLAGDGFPIGSPIPQCDSYEESYSIRDPQSPLIPNPPRMGQVGSGGGQISQPGGRGSAPIRGVGAESPLFGGQDGPIVGRYGLRIPPELIPATGDVVPILKFGGGEATRVTVRFFPTPVPSMPAADLDPCSACANIRINYIPSQGLTIDGTEERIYSTAYESVYRDGFFDGYTGRSFDQQANSLVTAIDGSPFEWPTLSCGVGYMMVVETYGTETASLALELSLAPRE